MNKRSNNDNQYTFSKRLKSNTEETQEEQRTTQYSTTRIQLVIDYRSGFVNTRGVAKDRNISREEKIFLEQEERENRSKQNYVIEQVLKEQGYK